MVGQRDEAGITGGFGKGRAQQRENDTLVERLEVPEMRAVIQHQDGHDLAVGQPRLLPALLGRLCLLAQQPSLPMRAKRLAKIIELAEILHEPVEHECLRPLMAPTQKEELKGDKSLASPQTHNSGLVCFLLRTFSQASTCSIKVCLSAIRRSRHCEVRTPSSDSAISSQLPCLGV